MDEKKVDEAWKDQVEKEKQKGAEAESPSTHQLPPVSLFTHITSIATQVMMSLGELEHPVANEKKISLPEARFGIDILGMLEEKTAGNRTDDETSYLRQILSELRMKYVKATEESPVKP